MLYTDKQVLFSEFLLKWDSSFKKIPSILKYLSSYPEITEKIEDFNLLESKDINNSQLEWISLVAQLERPIEYDFFKDYWVPIQKDKYGYFIDLSSEKISLFEAQYFCHEPYRWYKKFITRDLSQFLIDLDEPGFKIEEHLQAIEEEIDEIVGDLFFERDEMGFAGKLNPEPLHKSCILHEEIESNYILNGERITFKGVNSLIVALLPDEMGITLQAFRAPFNRHPDVVKKIKNIKALVYLLRSVGYLSIDYFSFNFVSDQRSKAVFKNNQLQIHSTDNQLLKSLVEQFEVWRASWIIRQ